MLSAYALANGDPVPVKIEPEEPLPATTVWVDLVGGSHEEIAAAEALLHTDIPEPEERREIEFSSRFYTDNGTIVATPNILVGVSRKEPILSPVTFLLANHKIATVRFEESQAFGQFMARAMKSDYACTDALSILFGILEAIIDRTADVVERVSATVDAVNTKVFARSGHIGRGSPRKLEELMVEIGYQSDLVAKARESLSSLERMLQYLGVVKPEIILADKKTGRMKLMSRDIRSLSDQLNFLSNKIGFMLEATLGLISIQQNEVIRVLTVAAMIFFPPTLVGTIYGMNFDFMPELHWTIGYPLALGAMVLSALLPFLYFKRRGWL